MEPDYMRFQRKRKKLVTELKTNTKKAKKIWLASDEDRERSYQLAPLRSTGIG